MIVRLIGFFSIFLLFITPEVFAYTVILKNGKRIEGTWVGQDHQVIRIKDEKGLTLSIKKELLDLQAMRLEFRQSETEQTPVIGAPGLRLQKKESRWAVEAGFSNVFDSNINHDSEEIVRSIGIVYSLGTRFQNHPKDPDYYISYEIGQHHYTETERWDRISHSLIAGYEFELTDKLQLHTVGEVSFNGSSEDRELGDQYVFRPVFVYEFNRSNEVEFYLAYRLRRFDNPLQNGTNRYFGFGYQRYFGKHAIRGRYRYEENNAINPRSDYAVATYNLDYRLPLPARMRASIGFRLRSQDYSDRYVEIEVEDGPDIEFLRRDDKWRFSAGLLIPVFGKLRLVPSYEFETRTSNDPEKPYDAHQFSLGITYDVW